MEWKNYITELDSGSAETSFDFYLPASDNSIKELRTSLELNELPKDVEELYRQTDGVSELWNGEKIGELVWPIDRVIETNRQYRSDPVFKKIYRTFDQFVFIADAGNGDLFGFTSIDGKFGRSDIFMWDHESDSRTWVAPDLATFLREWMEL